MKKADFYSFLRQIPKAEIHLHAEGTISRKTVKQLLARTANGKNPPPSVDSLFQYNTLKAFIDAFLFVQGLLDSPKDLPLVFEDVASYLKENGIVYCELFFAPSMFLKKGFDFSEMLELIQKTITTIEKRDKIEIHLIIDLSRTFGLANAHANLEATLTHKQPMVIGVGLGGDEEKGPAKEFADVFVLAKQKGLHVVAHAGEVVGPESIWDALKSLKAERIGHGLSAIYDKDLLHYLAAHQVPVEICLTSNVITNKYVKQVSEHPVREFYDQGILCVINTDDPTFFNSTLIDEFWQLHSKLNFSMDEIKVLIKNGFQASFLSEDKRSLFLREIDKTWEAATQQSLA